MVPPKIEKLSLADFTRYTGDALRRWHVDYERARVNNSDFFPAEQNFGAWLRFFVRYVAEDRAAMAKRDAEEK